MQMHYLKPRALRVRLGVKSNPTATLNLDPKPIFIGRVSAFDHIIYFYCPNKPPTNRSNKRVPRRPAIGKAVTEIACSTTTLTVLLILNNLVDCSKINISIRRVDAEIRGEFFR